METDQPKQISYYYKKRVSATDKKDILSLLRQGWSVQKISKLMHINPDVIDDIRIEQKVKVGKHLSKIAIDDIIEKYTNGISIKDIAEQIDRPYMTIYTMLKRKGYLNKTDTTKNPND